MTDAIALDVSDIQAACSDGCQVGLVVDDLDLAVIDAAFRSNNLEAGLPGLDISGSDLLTDQIDEGGNAFRGAGRVKSACVATRSSDA